MSIINAKEIRLGFEASSPKIFSNQGIIDFDATSKQALTDLFSGNVTPERYGAIGDGENDDSEALRTAIERADGKDVILKSGRTYRINSSLNVVGKNISIRSDGAQPAVIFQNGQTFTPINFSAPTTPVLTTSLNRSIKRGDKAWYMTSTEGVEEGMLMEVMSSKSWYHDPRAESTDARRSELHKVVRVDSNIVYCYDPANDGYNITTETVQVQFFKPIRVRLENIDVRSVRPAYAPTTKAVKGLVISRADSPMLKNVSVHDNASLGINITHCYRPIVDGGTVTGANYAAGSGYGVQTTGTSYAIIKNVEFYECNKSIDISGANIISRNSVIENNIVSGGGFTSTGEHYGYNEGGTVGNSQLGMGTHGPADNTIFRNNWIKDIYIAFNVHSQNVFIENNHSSGKLAYFVAASGENLYVRNNHHDDGWSYLKDGTTYNYNGSYPTTYNRCLRFVRIYTTGMTGNVVVTGNRADISHQFVSFQLPTLKPKSLIVKNNEISIRKIESSASTAAIVGKETTAFTLDNMIITSNIVIDDQGVPTTSLNTLNNITEGTNCIID